MNTMTIGQLADSAGVNVETIRYYQRRGLLTCPDKPGSGYRRYGDDDLSRLRFIKRAQNLGFSLDEAADLLALDEESDRERARELARDKIALVEERIHQLETMKTALQALVNCCESTRAPEPCPILHTLAAADGAA